MKANSSDTLEIEKEAQRKKRLIEIGIKERIAKKLHLELKKRKRERQIGREENRETN